MSTNTLENEDEFSLNRRKLLAVGGVSMAAIAGCTGVDDEDDQTDGSELPEDDGTDEEELQDNSNENNDIGDTARDFTECEHELNTNTASHRLVEDLDELDPHEESDLVSVYYDGQDQSEISDFLDEIDNVTVYDHLEAIDVYRIIGDRCGISELSNSDYVEGLEPRIRPEYP